MLALDIFLELDYSEALRVSEINARQIPGDGHIDFVFRDGSILRFVGDSGEFYPVRSVNQANNDNEKNEGIERPGRVKTAESDDRRELDLQSKEPRIFFIGVFRKK